MWFRCGAWLLCMQTRGGEGAWDRCGAWLLCMPGVCVWVGGMWVRCGAWLLCMPVRVGGGHVGQMRCMAAVHAR